MYNNNSTININKVMRIANVAFNSTVAVITFFAYLFTFNSNLATINTYSINANTSANIAAAFKTLSFNFTIFVFYVVLLVLFNALVYCIAKSVNSTNNY